jgi:hypothetical protein
MVVYSKIHTVFPDSYALVVMTGVASGVVNAWHMSRVMKSRKEHKIEVLVKHFCSGSLKLHLFSAHAFGLF